MADDDGGHGGVSALALLGLALIAILIQQRGPAMRYLNMKRM